MPKDPRHQLFVGIKDSVVALDVRDGTELWRKKLGGYGLVNAFWDGEQLFASAKGEVFCLDPRDGAILWHSQLKGLGTGMVTFASTRSPGDSQSKAVAAEKARQAAAHASHGAAS